jgi:hypothetical protein
LTVGEPSGVAVSGSDLFVTNSSNNTIGEYTTAGATVNAALISGLSSPEYIAIAAVHAPVIGHGLPAVLAVGAPFWRQALGSGARGVVLLDRDPTRSRMNENSTARSPRFCAAGRPFSDQADDTPIGDQVLQEADQPFLPHRVEQRPNVRIKEPVARS